MEEKTLITKRISIRLHLSKLIIFFSIIFLNQNAFSQIVFNLEFHMTVDSVGDINSFCKYKEKVIFDTYKRVVEIQYLKDSSEIVNDYEINEVSDSAYYCEYYDSAFQRHSVIFRLTNNRISHDGVPLLTYNYVIPEYDADGNITKNIPDQFGNDTYLLQSEENFVKYSLIK